MIQMTEIILMVILVLPSIIMSQLQMLSIRLSTNGNDASAIFHNRNDNTTVGGGGCR
jgi:hypothetical protein